MPTIAIVSPGFMGAGLGWALRRGGARVVATAEGRSGRTHRLAGEAGIELLPGLADAVAVADVVLSVTPPGAAVAAARTIDAAVRAAGVRPVLADLNAVAPATMTTIARTWAGLPVADGSISGAPPTVRSGARLYLSGPAAADLAALPWDGHVRPVVLDAGVGGASALKMCTASVYKGLNGLVTQAMRVAGRHGVLDEVLADLAENGLDLSAAVPTAATKAARFVDEMHEIAATQAAAGLTPALFEAFAEVYADIAATALAAGDPESAGPPLTPEEMVRRLAPSRRRQ
jgi:3-hydroxyisobutyrate dehydrogenase-like beta-hydroxyacid dehydrogenase